MHNNDYEYDFEEENRKMLSKYDETEKETIMGYMMYAIERYGSGSDVQSGRCRKLTKEEKLVLFLIMHDVIEMIEVEKAICRYVVYGRGLIDKYK